MHRILSCCFLLSVAMSASAALKQGETAPLFATQASFGGKNFTYTLKDAIKEGPVVVYFYPTAFGGGCSVQAHEFAESYEKFAAAGVSIVGVSLDDIGRLNEFSADPKYCASKFPVASDVDGKIANSFDLAVNESTRGRKDNRGVTVEHGSVDRTTFIVGKDGKIIATVGGLKPAENVEKALQIVQALAAAK